MKKIKLLYIVFLFPVFLFAQIKPTKSLIEKLILKSKVEIKKGKFSLPANTSWEFNNTDNYYYKKDTLDAFLYKEGTKHKSLCESVNWTFYKKNAFILGQESICKEPPTRNATQYPKDYFTISINNVENKIVINILKNDKTILESYIVREIVDTKEYTKIKFVRSFKNN